MNERIAFLQTVAPFNLLPADVLEGFADLVKETKYTRDTFIYHQEVTKMRGVNILAEGEYKFFFYDTAQDKRLIEIHQSGYCYGGMSVLLNQRNLLELL